MIVTGTPLQYKNPHNKRLKPSVNIRCSATEAYRLHEHYDMCIRFMDLYWHDNWKLGPFGTKSHDRHMNDNLKYKPIKDNKKPNKYMKSVGWRRFQHMPEDWDTLGKFYNHYQMKGMLAEKVWKKRSKNELEDWTESMYHRWNFYVDWLKQWDITYNNGSLANDETIDELKVHWYRLDSIILEDPSIVK